MKAKRFCGQCFDPVTGLECSYGKIFIPVTEISEISVVKTEISVTGPAKLSYEHIVIFTKKRMAKRDLGNRASLVDRAHMKRPSECNLVLKMTPLVCIYKKIRPLIVDYLKVI